MHVEWLEDVTELEVENMFGWCSERLGAAVRRCSGRWGAVVVFSGWRVQQLDVQVRVFVIRLFSLYDLINKLAKGLPDIAKFWIK